MENGGIMNTYDLQLRKNGILVAKEWDHRIRDYTERVIENEDIIFHLDDTICLDRNVLLKDLFLLIIQNTKLWSVVTSCQFLDELMEEALSPVVQDEDTTGINFLELDWLVSVSADEDDASFIFEHTDFHGVGENETYAIEFTPLNKLAPLPLVLNEGYIIRDENDKSVFNTRKKFSLGKLVKEIMLELSFIGTPDMKAVAIEDLRERVKDVETGKAKTTSWEKIRKEMDERAEREKKPCKLCGEDARSPIFHKPPDVCAKCFKKMKEN